MSGQYNSRPRAAEILVDGTQNHVIRRRETIDELFEHEVIPNNI
ncbi:diaminopimelate decarboxylase [Oligella ureolytica]